MCTYNIKKNSGANMSSFLNTLFFITQISAIFAALPPIQKCQLSDAGCLKKSAQNAMEAFIAGVPEAGTEPLDPLVVDSIKIDLSGLNLNIKDADIKGLKSAVVDKLSFDTAKKQLQLVFHANILLKGQYKAGGRLLILPISGEGDATLKIKNLEVVVTMPYDIVKANGKDVIELKSYKYTFDVKENTHYRLSNLFNGNKVLSDAMHTFMNDNWKAITQEFGDPMLEKPMMKIFNSIKAYLKSQPLEDITNP